MTIRTKKIIGIICTIAVIALGFIGEHGAQPTVSVVMPVYNRSDLVGRAIESILNQTFTDFEFIIVDDGSTDNTPDIVRSYAKKDKRIRFLSYGRNRGVGYARQYGLDAARGEFVAVMDSDDWATPDRLEKSVAFMRDYPDLAAMTAGIRNIKEAPLPGTDAEHDLKQKGRQPSPAKDGKIYQVGTMPGFYEIELAFYNSFPNVSSMYRRDFIMKHNIRYQAHIISAEDYDFWRQVAMAGGRMGSIRDTVVYIRSHRTNSAEYYSAMHKNSLEIHRQMFSRFFTPTDNELKFSYNELEKCRFLNKMIAANEKKAVVPHTWLTARFEARCPKRYEDAVFLEHLNWSGFLVPTADGRFQRYGTKIKADIELNGDKITVLWDKWQAETFEKSREGWKFIPKGERLKVSHPDWSDELIVDEKDDKRVCRRGKMSDCARIRVRTDNRLIIKWDNVQWPIESFTFDLEDKKWIFEKGRHLNVLHSDWKDEFVLSPDKQRVCRLGSADCARVTRLTDSNLTIEWENPAWGQEEFKKEATGVWRVYAR